VIRKLRLIYSDGSVGPWLVLEKNMAEFGGVTYNAERDRGRLSKQLDDVKRVMGDGNWRTLGELEAITGHTQASVSARLRDLRKPKHGANTVERQYVTQGLWRYRVVKP